ncbi:MAG TPA: hypothetical protein VGS57_18940 [Thermoanaerobaculia bacterium]|jgi:hypothetical protein|nr:hypothetical protein [Thermoanaerobaculia bacterium]
MNQHLNQRPLLLLASLALATSVLGACSQGHSSPTEPSLSFDSAKSFAADSSSADGATASVSGDVAAKRHGADDGNGSGGGGNDDGTLDQGGGNNDDPAGADDNNNHRQRRRGRQNPGGDNPQQPRAPRGGAEFAATVQSVAGSTITLVDGTRVLVNGQTQWNARGDLRTLDALAKAVAANRAPRVEGRGTRQADGSIVALTIKAEIDGADD